MMTVMMIYSVDGMDIGDTDNALNNNNNNNTNNLSVQNDYAGTTTVRSVSGNSG